MAPSNKSFILVERVCVLGEFTIRLYKLTVSTIELLVNWVVLPHSTVIVHRHLILVSRMKDSVFNWSYLLR
jgi:hypothetical protein